MVLLVVVALEMVACGGRKGRRKVIGCACYCRGTFCCLAGGCGCASGVDVEMMVMNRWCWGAELVAGVDLLRVREKKIKGGCCFFFRERESDTGRERRRGKRESDAGAGWR